jgi:hypothetical protein
VAAGDAKQFIADRVTIEDRGYSSPCWVWQKALTEKGYGRSKIPGFRRTMRVHRATYELYVGPIPEGLTIDHLCRIKSCCNPDHLEAVTAIENCRRAPPPVRAERTHCSEGHELTPENVCAKGCRACINAYMRKWRRSASPEWRERQNASNLAYYHRQKASA